MRTASGTPFGRAAHQPFGTLIYGCRITSKKIGINAALLEGPLITVTSSYNIGFRKSSLIFDFFRFFVRVHKSVQENAIYGINLGPHLFNSPNFGVKLQFHTHPHTYLTILFHHFLTFLIHTETSAEKIRLAFFE